MLWKILGWAIGAGITTILMFIMQLNMVVEIVIITIGSSIGFLTTHGIIKLFGKVVSNQAAAKDNLIVQIIAVLIISVVFALIFVTKIQYLPIVTEIIDKIFN